ncbi:MAG: hypothetical protein ACPG4X_15440 [Pikeienuella sp.]
MTDLDAAVNEYLRREAAAMKTPQCAHHAELIEQVAVETGIETDVLTEAVLDATFTRAN